MWFVYILRCANGSLYVGETNDLERRVARHHEGTGATHTARHGPVRLVHTEEYATRMESLKRERQLKRWTRAKKEALIEGDLRTLKRL